uniref:Uncharacterized protein n=1 Tax=Oreochromis aureus TaxID=47969 RepID=A0AAZ1XZF2_OREAU
VFESRWVLVEAFSDYPAGLRQKLEFLLSKLNYRTFFLMGPLSVCSISHGELLEEEKKKSSNQVSTVSHYCGEMLMIVFFFFNVFALGVMEFDGLVSPYNDQGRADVYQGCADCLTVVYSGVFQGIPGRLLLIYRKEGKHTDTDELKTDESIHRKLAECLKFNVETTFIYDGKGGERENLEIS